MGQQAQQFRRLLTSDAFIVSPGVYDGYSIRLVEAAGFSCASTSGAAISNALLGVPDAGVMGLSENVNHCRHLARSVSIPLTADADTGYGNPMNVHYTVQQFEEAGVAGVNIEDQVSPKRCGHMPGKDVVPAGEMVRKIEAACLARKDDAFAIVARTDAIAVEGLQPAIERAVACVEAGADMIFPEAIYTLEQYRQFKDAVKVPILANITEFGQTPLFTTGELQSAGVDIVLYCCGAYRAMNKAALNFYETVRRDGTQKAAVPSMQTRAELYDFLGYHAYEQKLDALFAGSRDE